jgi:biopolymer transport protein TolR
MGMSQPSNRGGGKTSLAEINVTPMVDVMLVLLIVFMVSAPLMQQGIEVNLPKADAGTVNQSEDPVILTIKANQTLELDQKSYSLSALGAKLSALALAKPNLQVLVQADQSVPYGVVAKTMAQVKKSKIHRVGLITSPETKGE